MTSRLCWQARSLVAVALVEVQMSPVPDQAALQGLAAAARVCLSGMAGALRDGGGLEALGDAAAVAAAHRDLKSRLSSSSLYSIYS
jgi:hypothetical protein